MELNENNKHDCADMMAILADLEHSRDCAKILIDNKYDPKDDMRVCRALYESALISYRRAFNHYSTRYPTDGNNKVWKIPSNVKVDANNGYEDEVGEIDLLASKQVAHRSIKKAREVTFPEDADEIAVTCYKQRNDLMSALFAITDRYIKVLQKDLIPKCINQKES